MPRQIENTLTLFPELFAETPAAVRPAKAPAVSIAKDDAEFLAWRKNIETLAAQHDLRGILTGYSNIRYRWYHTMEFVSNCALANERSNQRNRTQANGLTLDTFTESYDREANENHASFTLHFIYLDKAANTHIVPVSVKMLMQNNHYDRNYFVQEINVGKTMAPGKLVENTVMVTKYRDAVELLVSKKPYLKDWLDMYIHAGTIARYLCCPWVETLDKAGYAIARNLIREDCEVISHKDLYNRLLGPGTKPKDIFKTDKCIYTTLKTNADIKRWDVLRRMQKTGKINEGVIQAVIDRNWSDKELEQASRILGQKQDGRPLFTWTSLINYIGRLDMYEAIDVREALPLLSDYVNMCRQLGMTPRTDGDSLKREHDIAARLCRERRNEIAAREMQKRKEEEQKAIAEGNTKLARMEYHEKVFFVRPITDYDDLLDEAHQQHNCVASYWQYIAEGKSRVFTMRETAHPETSLITIELSPDCRTVKQKYLAYNQPIHNKAQSEFIERWLRQLNQAA